MRGGRLRLLAALTALFPGPLDAQVDVTGYWLSVASHATESDVGGGGTTALGRGRLMIAAEGGAMTVDLAYEHVVSRQPDGVHSRSRREVKEPGPATGWAPTGRSRAPRTASGGTASTASASDSQRGRSISP